MHAIIVVEVCLPAKEVNVDDVPASMGAEDLRAWVSMH